MKTWLFTDTHFNHARIIEYEGRPADYQNLIVSNVRRLVNHEDLVIHLGDVILGRQSELPEIMGHMRGTWLLVRGNHDSQTDAWYRKRGFAAVFDALSIRGVWLTHAPAASLPCGHTLNVHGHLHGDGHRDHEFNLAAHNKLLAIERTNYCPVEFNSFTGK